MYACGLITLSVEGLFLLYACGLITLSVEGLKLLLTVIMCTISKFGCASAVYLGPNRGGVISYHILKMQTFASTLWQNVYNCMTLAVKLLNILSVHGKMCRNAGN